jgi:hypothetical protein
MIKNKFIKNMYYKNFVVVLYLVPLMGFAQSVGADESAPRPTLYSSGIDIEVSKDSLEQKCFEIAKSGSKKALDYGMPFKDYPAFLQKATAKESHLTVFMTHASAPVFHFQQYRYGRKIFAEGEERYATLLQAPEDSPAFRTHEFEINFLYSVHPETQEKFLEYCGTRVIRPIADEKKVFHTNLQNFGMLDPVEYGTFENIEKDGKKFKTVIKNRLIRTPEMEPLAEQKAFAVFPENIDNNFWNLYESVPVIKQLFDQKSGAVAEMQKRAVLTTVQESNPKIEEDRTLGLVLINGIPHSKTVYRGIRDRFYQYLILTQKEIAPYLTTAVFRSDESNREWANFLSGRETEIPEEIPVAVPSLPLLKPALDEAQAIEKEAFQPNPCIPKEAIKHFEAQLQALNQKYQLESFHQEALQRPSSENNIIPNLPPDVDWNAYQKERWDLEKKFRNTPAHCAKKEATEKCPETEAMKQERAEAQKKQIAETEKAQSISDTRERLRKIAGIDQEFQQSMQRINRSCHKVDPAIEEPLQQANIPQSQNNTDTPDFFSKMDGMKIAVLSFLGGFTILFAVIIFWIIRQNKRR